jgi:hypothetical protein
LRAHLPWARVRACGRARQNLEKQVTTLNVQMIWRSTVSVKGFTPTACLMLPR